MEPTLQRCPDDHIAVTGENSMNNYNLIHNFIPTQKAMKVRDAKASVEKECK